MVDVLALPALAAHLSSNSSRWDRNALKNWKGLSLILALLGVGAATLIVAWSGFGRVAAATLSVGYGGFALLCAWQLLVTAVLGIGWRVIAPVARGRQGLSLPFIWARLVRDASASCLPVAQVGGFAIGARALSLHGQPWPVAVTSTVGDLSAEFLAEIIFAVASLVVLVDRHIESLAAVPWALGIALAVIVGSGLLLLPRRAAPLLARLGRRVLPRGFDFAGRNVDSLVGDLAQIYGRVDHFAASNAIHLLGWVGKGAGGWIAFRLLGAPVGLIDALAIEGLLHVALAAVFIVPGYAGVQEGAYVLLGAAFGVPPEIALGTSLLRRARDIVIGIPVLLVWQLVELRRLRKTYG